MDGSAASAGDSGGSRAMRRPIRHYLNVHNIHIRICMFINIGVYMKCVISVNV